MKYLSYHFDAEDFYLCKTFWRNLARRLSKLDTFNKEKEQLKSSSINETNPNETTMSPVTIVTEGSDSPTKSKYPATMTKEVMDLMRDPVFLGPRDTPRSITTQLT